MIVIAKRLLFIIAVSVFLYNYVFVPGARGQDVQFDKKTIERLSQKIKSMPGYIDVLAKVDTTFVQLADMTFDGEPDSVILTIKGESLVHPFVWSLKVQSKGQTIYQHIKDDSGMDKFFNDPGYVSNTQDPYFESKTTYYFQWIHRNIIEERRFPLRQTGSLLAAYTLSQKKS